MSIHPEFAERILRGEKLVEFRRRPLGRKATHIVIYATAPVGAVVGFAEIERVECGSPRALWKTFRSVGGIERVDFFSYFEGTTTGYAYVLKRAQACESPVQLGCSGLPTRAPQAFQYLEAPTLDAILNSSSAGSSEAALAG